MTPFQRQVIDAARAKEAEEQQRQQEQMQQQHGQGGSPARNTRAGGAASGGSKQVGDRQETVRYVNRTEYPDHDVHHDSES